MGKVESTKKRRITELDALRGIAALAVVLFHYTTRFYELFDYNYITQYWQFPYGHYGVTLFFIISGFVIFMTVDKIKSPMDFIVHRFIRLYPIYWVCMILTFVTIYILNVPSLQVSIIDFIANFTMIAAQLRFKFVDGVYWTLAIELCFYVLMFILIISKQTKRITMLGFTYLALICLLVLFNKYTTLIFYSTLFLAGINFYKLWQQEGQKYMFHLQIFLCFSYTLFSHNLSLIISTALFYLVFYLFIYEKMKFLNLRFFLFMGEISYVLYLIHQVIGYAIQIRLIETMKITNSFLLLSIPLITSLLLSTFITYVIDIPLRKKILDKWKKRTKVL